MFEHDYPAYLDDFQYMTTKDGLTVRISKVGGGTVGKKYEGFWHYHIEGNGEIMSGSDLQTGMPRTHEDVAEIAADSFTAYVEEG